MFNTIYPDQQYKYQIDNELRQLISDGENLLRQINSILRLNQIGTEFTPNISYPLSPSIGFKKTNQNRKKIKDITQSIISKNPIHTEIEIWEKKIDEFSSRYSINYKNLTLAGNSDKIKQKFNQSRKMQTPAIRVEQFIQCLKECEKLDLVPNYLLPKILNSENKIQGTTKNAIPLTVLKEINKKSHQQISKKKTKISRAKKNSIFISYTHESEDHMKWVKKLRSRLRLNGFNVYLDQDCVDLGSDLNYFMESSINNSKFVLIICTPAYYKKAMARKGGAGTEYDMIVSEKTFTQNKIQSNFICILRKGNQHTAIPLYFQSTYYKDFKDNNEFNKNVKDLVRRLKELPRK